MACSKFVKCIYLVIFVYTYLFSVCSGVCACHGYVERSEENLLKLFLSYPVCGSKTWGTGGGGGKGWEKKNPESSKDQLQSPPGPVWISNVLWEGAPSRHVRLGLRKLRVPADPHPRLPCASEDRCLAIVPMLPQQEQGSLALPAWPRYLRMRS